MTPATITTRVCANPSCPRAGRAQPLVRFRLWRFKAPSYSIRCETCRRTVRERMAAHRQAGERTALLAAEQKATMERALIRDLRRQLKMEQDARVALARDVARLRGKLHELVRPDNGYCNQCGGHWLYRPNGSWVYTDGEHRFACIGGGVQ